MLSFTTNPERVIKQYVNFSNTSTFGQNTNISLIIGKAVREKKDLYTTVESIDLCKHFGCTLTTANKGEDEFIQQLAWSQKSRRKLLTGGGSGGGIQ